MSSTGVGQQVWPRPPPVPAHLLVLAAQEPGQRTVASSHFISTNFRQKQPFMGGVAVVTMMCLSKELEYDSSRH